MKLQLAVFLLLNFFFSIIANAQNYLGKSYLDVHKQFKALKGDNLYNFIELEPQTLNYGFKNDKKKQKIYKYSAMFNDNNVCIVEIWSDFKTKEEALVRLKKNIVNKKLEYIQTTDEGGDMYLLFSDKSKIQVNIVYAEDGYKEYLISFKYYKD